MESGIPTVYILLPERSAYHDLERRKAIVRSYRMLGRHSEAEETLRELLRWYGGHALARCELGQVLEETGRVEEAVSEYERFLEMWSEADEGLPQLIDARQRLAALRGDRS